MDDHIQNTSVCYHTTPAYATFNQPPNNAHHTQTRGVLPGEIHLGHKEVDVDPVRISISIWRTISLDRTGTISSRWFSDNIFDQANYLYTITIYWNCLLSG